MNYEAWQQQQAALELSATNEAKDELEAIGGGYEVEILDITDQKQEQRVETKAKKAASNRAAEDRELAASRAQAASSQAQTGTSASKAGKGRGGKVASAAEASFIRGGTAAAAGGTGVEVVQRRTGRVRMQTKLFTPPVRAPSSEKQPIVPEQPDEDEAMEGKYDNNTSTDLETAGGTSDDNELDSEYSSTSTSTGSSNSTTKRKRQTIHTGMKVRQAVHTRSSCNRLVQR